MAIPDVPGFSLSQVKTEVNSGAAHPYGLSNAFTDAISAKFDATYSGAKDRLSNFRNYGAVTITEVYIIGLIELNGGTQYVWSNPGTTLIGAGAQSDSDGVSNTAAIVAGVAISSAKLCNDYTDGTYSDWYKPAINELQKLYDNRIAVNIGLNAQGGDILLLTIQGNYFSSTEVNSTTAKRMLFLDASITTPSKSSTGEVRAVRKASPTGAHSIGDFFQGGIIYDLK